MTGHDDWYTQITGHYDNLTPWQLGLHVIAASALAIVLGVIVASDDVAAWFRILLLGLLTFESTALVVGSYRKKSA